MGTGLQLEVNVAERVSANGERTAPSRSSVCVSATATTVVYVIHRQRSVELDFPARRRRTFDHAAGTVLAESLYGRPFFRGAEVQNRRNLRDVLAAGGADSRRDDFSELLAEHHLSALAPERRPTIGKRPRLPLRRAPDILVEENGDGSAFLALGKRIAWFSREGFAHDALSAFLHHVRLECGGHPLVLRWLAQTGRVPRALKLAELHPIEQGGEVSFEVTPTDAAQPFAPPADAKEITGHEDCPEGALLARPCARNPATVEARLAECLRRLHGADPMGGLLSFFEITLETGAGLTPELDAALKSTQHGPTRRLYETLLAPKETGAQAVGALNTFQELRALAGPMAFVIGTFEAAVHLGFKRKQDARRLLVEALTENPRLAAAWKDLGDVCAQSWEMDLAWACWLRARELAPAAACGKEVAGRQRALEEAHPEYFRP